MLTPSGTVPSSTDLGQPLPPTTVWGAATLALSLIRHASRADMADRTARGLGKILWMKGFEPQFYGQRELDRLKRAAERS